MFFLEGHTGVSAIGRRQEYGESDNENSHKEAGYEDGFKAAFWERYCTGLNFVIWLWYDCSLAVAIYLHALVAIALA